MIAQPAGDVFHYLVLVQLADAYQFPFTGCAFLNNNVAFIYTKNTAEIFNQLLIGSTSYRRFSNPYVQDSFIKACNLIPACIRLDLNNQLCLFFFHYDVIYSITSDYYAVLSIPEKTCQANADLATKLSSIYARSRNR